MVKYRILKPFKDKKTGELYSVGDEIDMTVKRAKEAETNLKEHGGGFLERVEEKGDE